MQDVAWRRSDLIAEIKDDLWRYLTPSASIEQDVLEAAALLQMPSPELRTLGRLHFLLSDEVGWVLKELPKTVRRLTTTHRARKSGPRSGSVGQSSGDGRLVCGTQAVFRTCTSPRQRDAHIRRLRTNYSRLCLTRWSRLVESPAGISPSGSTWGRQLAIAWQMPNDGFRRELSLRSSGGPLLLRSSRGFGRGATVVVMHRLWLPTPSTRASRRRWIDLRSDVPSKPEV